MFGAPNENAVDEPRTKDPEGAVTPAVTPPLYASLRMFNAVVRDTRCRVGTPCRLTACLDLQIANHQWPLSSCLQEWQVDRFREG